MKSKKIESYESNHLSGEIKADIIRGIRIETIQQREEKQTMYI